MRRVSTVTLSAFDMSDMSGHFPQVKMWITLNEPWATSVLGYGDGTFAPGVRGIGDSVYVAAHNQIRAHAKAYRDGLESGPQVARVFQAS